jgi:ferrous-iron efflux pump FieF
MDREWPEDKRLRFIEHAARHPELSKLHDLRTRTSGNRDFVQFHVWVPGEWTVQQAHDRIDPIEEQLQKRFPATEILIHLDPEGHTDRETLLPPELTESQQ